MASKLENISANSDLPELWEIFKQEHNKSYETEEENKLRFELFKESVERVIEHNAKYEKGEVSFGMGLNKFSDLKPEEKKMFTGSLRP